MYFTHDMLAKEALLILITGVAMHCFAVAIFLIAIGFYIFAFFKLPSSVQERIFLEGAREAITQHQRKSSKINTKKAQRND